MNPHDQLMQDLLAERFSTPTPPPTTQTPIDRTALADLLAELSNDEDEEVA